MLASKCNDYWSTPILRNHALFLYALAATVALGGCGEKRALDDRLWPDEWTRYQCGDTWVSGIALKGEREIAGHRGDHLRMVLLGLGEESAQVSLDGGGLKLRWTVRPGERLAVDEELPEKGNVRLRGGGGVVLGEPRQIELRKEPKTVVLVLVDTLRDDFVSQRHTPRILKALGEGRRFVDTTANAPWTIPSVASIMTSRPVLEITAPDGALIGIPQGLVTLPGAFFDAGFSTAGLVANPTVHEANGFGMGFTELAVPDPRAGDDPWDVRDLVIRGRSWLQERTGEDRFLYIHLMEPHEPFRDHRGDRPEPPSMRVLAHRERAATGEEEVLIRRLYAGEVRRLDRYLAPFLEDLPEGSTAVLVSDHGELLGEHQSWGHGLTLFQEVLKVPLILESPGVEPGIEERPVQLLDLGPTLLELAGVPVPKEMKGRSLFQGGSAEPITAATFSAGPLRWACRIGSKKVTLRTFPQPGLAPEGQTRVLETHPQAAGAYQVDLVSDPWERKPGSLDRDTLLDAASVFAATVGGLIPGQQILAVGLEGPLKVNVEGRETLEVRQVIAFGATAGEEEDLAVRLAWETAFPFALVVLSELVPPPGLRVTPEGISMFRSGSEPMPPAIRQSGLYLWETRRTPLEQGGQDETIRRLRALGYLE